LDGYGFWIEPKSTAPTADLWLHVVAVKHSSAVGSSGTFRELAVHKITNGMSLLDSAAGIDASLEVTTVAGDVVITARIHVITVAGAKIAATIFNSTLLGGTVTLGTDVTQTAGGVLTDANAAKITTGNGVGWGMYSTRTDTVSSVGVDVVEGIASFRVTDSATGLVSFHDDFARVAQGPYDVASVALFRRVTDALGNVGAWLNSGWAYGATAATDNTVDDVDPLLGQVETGTTFYDGTAYIRAVMSQTNPTVNEPLTRTFYSTRPADYDYSQHRSVEFKPFDHQVAEANWTGALDRYGVLVRGAVVAGVMSTCFCAYAEAAFTKTLGALDQTGLIVRLAVRFQASLAAAPTYLVLWSKTVAGVDLADGAWHRIQYDMHVVESANDTNAPVIHEVRLDGSTIVFDTPGTYSTGTTVLTDGRIVDNGNYGPGYKTFVEGFFLDSSVSITDVAGNLLLGPAPIRLWKQETLTVLETTTPPDEMPSFAWAPSDEANLAASGTLTSVCDVTFPVDIKVVASSPIGHMGEQGHRYHRNRATRDRHLFRFNTGPLLAADKDTLLAFWSARGVVTPFNFALTHDRAFICNFAEKPRFTKVDAKHWTAQVSLMERLA